MSLRPRSLSVLLALLLAGCVDDAGPTSAELENAVHALLGGLEVGEALALSGAEAASVFLAGGPEGADYLYIPFFASEAGEARLQVEVTGSNLETVGSSPARAPAAPITVGWRRDEGIHERMLESAARELGPRLSRRSVLAPGSARGARRSASRAPVPARVGAIVPLNTAASCAAAGRDLRYGRVEAVGSTAILVADTANPAGGMTSEDYRTFAEQFDAFVLPTLTRHFGEPTDVDENDRVVVFFTRAVNELTPPNSGSYVGGFFWPGDLFPQEICPGSNEAEVFYQLVADPGGEVNANAFPTEFVRASTVGVLGHELQHLINASRRIYVNDAVDFEETWLDEGLSHVAEELLFYAASGTQPGQNIDIGTVRSSETIRNAANAYMYDNLVRFALYLQRPEEESLLGIDDLETRGATWAFLRYAADHDPRSDQEVFRALANSRVSGTENLSRVLGSDAVDLMQAWTVSVYADDHPVVTDARFQQPSWNFRSLVPELYFDRRFPLRVRSLGPDRDLSLRLRGGGAAFVTLRGAATRQAMISTTSGGRTPPDRLRISVLRIR